MRHTSIRLTGIAATLLLVSSMCAAQSNSANAASTSDARATDSASTSAVHAQATESSLPNLPEPENPAATVNVDVSRILKFMRDGDAKSLIDLYQSAHDPVIHVWSAMAIERVRFNLDAATHAAKVCEDTLIEQQPAIALLCGQFQTGDLRLAGHWQEAMNLESDLIQRYRNRHVDKQIDAMQEYWSHEHNVAQFQFEAPDADVALALDRDSPQPKFDALANGNTFKLMLDTGASQLVLGQSLAQRLNVQSTDRTGKASGWESKDVPVQYGVLDTLQLGAITLRHVPVRIVPRQIALMGINLLAPFGTIRVTQGTLTIAGSHSDTAATCEDQMVAATDIFGNSLRLIPTFLINDTPQSVGLDTGAGKYLIGTQAALDEVVQLRRRHIAHGDIGGTHRYTAVEDAKVKLTISGQPIDVVFDVLRDSNVPRAITLGAGALRDMDFVLDFRHQHLCFPMHANLH